jgi:hypothetical protein
VNWVDKAGNEVAYQLILFAHTISEEGRDSFFHPMNRDTWVAEFCRWLAEKQRISAEIRASND